MWNLESVSFVFSRPILAISTASQIPGCVLLENTLVKYGGVSIRKLAPLCFWIGIAAVSPARMELLSKTYCFSLRKRQYEDEKLVIERQGHPDAFVTLVLSYWIRDTSPECQDMIELQWMANCLQALCALSEQFPEELSRMKAEMAH